MAATAAVLRSLRSLSRPHFRRKEPEEQEEDDFDCDSETREEREGSGQERDDWTERMVHETALRRLPDDPFSAGSNDTAAVFPPFSVANPNGPFSAEGWGVFALQTLRSDVAERLFERSDELFAWFLASSEAVRDPENDKNGSDNNGGRDSEEETVGGGDRRGELLAAFGALRDAIFDGVDRGGDVAELLQHLQCLLDSVAFSSLMDSGLCGLIHACVACSNIKALAALCTFSPPQAPTAHTDDNADRPTTTVVPGLAQLDLDTLVSLRWYEGPDGKERDLEREYHMSLAPLHLAVVLCLPEVVHALLDSGADALVETALRAQPVHLALLLGWLNPRLVDADDVAALPTGLVSDEPVASAVTRRSFSARTGAGFVRHHVCAGAEFAAFLLGIESAHDGFYVPPQLLGDSDDSVLCDHLRADYLLEAILYCGFPAQDVLAIHEAAMRDRGLSLAAGGKDVGLGVFASRDLPAGSLVATYAGLIRHVPVLYADRACRHYAFGLEIQMDSGSSMGTHAFHIDGEPLRNVGPMVNHASVNFNVVPQWAVFGGVLYPVLVAVRDVSSGEQLCYNYGDTWCSFHGIAEATLVS
jgi:SET domain